MSPPSPAGCHDRAVLLYEYVGKRIVDLQHTEVPDAYRGRGIAKHLAKVGVRVKRRLSPSEETVALGASRTLSRLGGSADGCPPWPECRWADGCPFATRLALAAGSRRAAGGLLGSLPTLAPWSGGRGSEPRPQALCTSPPPGPRHLLCQELLGWAPASGTSYVLSKSRWDQ